MPSGQRHTRSSTSWCLSRVNTSRYNRAEKAAGWVARRLWCYGARYAWTMQAFCNHFVSNEMENVIHKNICAIEGMTVLSLRVPQHHKVEVGHMVMSYGNTRPEISLNQIPRTPSLRNETRSFPKHHAAAGLID